MMTTSRMRVAVVAVVAAAGIALVGCTPNADPTWSPSTSASSTPSATPTPTPTVAAPSDENDATTAAENTTQAYVSLEVSLLTDWPGEAAAQDLIDQVAFQQAASDLADSAKAAADAKQTVSGSSTFVSRERSAGPLTLQDGTQVPFGSALVAGCLDTTNVITKDAAGTVVPKQGVTVVLASYTVLFNPTESRWLVSNVEYSVSDQCGG